MYQNVNKPTFQNELGVETNVLDLILTENNNRVYMLQHTQPLGGIDHGHHVLEFRYSYCNSKRVNELVNKPKLLHKKGNFVSLNHFSNNIDWNKEFIDHNVDECYNKWLEFYEVGCDLYIPRLSLIIQTKREVSRYGCLKSSRVYATQREIYGSNVEVQVSGTKMKFVIIKYLITK